MKLFSGARRTSYCAFCKSPRRLYRRKHVGLTNVLTALIGAGAMCELFYGGPDPVGLGYFSFFVISAEMFVYLRWRAALTCRMCGFDPLVYRRDPRAASAQVREFFDRMGDDPKFMLSKSPLVDVHRRARERDRQRRDIEGVRARALVKNGGTAAPAVVNPVANENTGHHSDVQRA